MQGDRVSFQSSLLWQISSSLSCLFSAHHSVQTSSDIYAKHLKIHDLLHTPIRPTTYAIDLAEVVVELTIFSSSVTCVIIISIMQLILGNSKYFITCQLIIFYFAECLHCSHSVWRRVTCAFGSCHSRCSLPRLISCRLSDAKVDARGTSSTIVLPLLDCTIYPDLAAFYKLF